MSYLIIDGLDVHENVVRTSVLELVFDLLPRGVDGTHLHVLLRVGVGAVLVALDTDLHSIT